MLLDFGLCKHLASSERLAFCGLIHALSELDPDRLLASLTTLGFVFKQTPEPFDALRALLCDPSPKPASRPEPAACNPLPHSPFALPARSPPSP